MNPKERAKRDRANEARKLKRKTDPAWAKARDAARHRGAAHVPEGQQIAKLSLLTNEQTGELEASWTKTEKVAGPVVAPPPGFLLKKVSTYTVAGEARAQWTSHSPEAARQWEETLAAMKTATEEYRGIADPIPMPTMALSDRLINVVPIGDPHFGMYAWSKETGQPFDCDIAEADLKRVLTDLFLQAPDAETCLIADLGDTFHAEDDNARTPRGGNPLDADTRSGRVTKIVYKVFRWAIELGLRTHKKVIFMALRGNHDPYKSLGLSLYLQGVFENEPRVEILDNNNPYIFYEFGNNLFGFHHGDGAKPEQLPGIMASYARGVPWGRCIHRRWFTGHVHSFNGKDFAGCTWESFRTLAPGDFWAHWKGYRSEQSIDCLTFDIEKGLKSRSRETLLQMEAA